MPSITFIRHLRVKFVWPRYCNSAEFSQACYGYDLAQVEEGVCRSQLPVSVVYTSDQSRTQHTARVLFGSHIRKIPTPLLNEVPIAPFMHTRYRLPTFLWLVAARLQWWFNSKQQPESRYATRRRIAACVDQFLLQDKDVVLIGHGFYFSAFVKEIMLRGAKGPKNPWISYGESMKFFLPGEVM